MLIRISRVHFPVTVLGPGRRLGIWFQGCSIGCAGCVSRDTWDPLAGDPVSVSALIDKCREMTGDELDGITITGGEPFEQPAAFAALLDAMAEWRADVGFDVLCYSGFPLKRLRQEHAALLARLDALIPEPFVLGRPPDAPWRGSGNQPLVVLSERGRERYATLPAEGPAIQLAVSDGAIWFIGIPRRGDLERMRAMAADQGLVLEDVSWTS